jgi:hypothetical protein
LWVTRATASAHRCLGGHTHAAASRPQSGCSSRSPSRPEHTDG